MKDALYVLVGLRSLCAPVWKVRRNILAVFVGVFAFPVLALWVHGAQTKRIWPEHESDEVPWEVLLFVSVFWSFLAFVLNVLILAPRDC